MSLVTNLQSAFTRVATEFKSLRTLVNGNAADLSALTTTAKSNLVLAVNEINAKPTGGSNLDALSDVVITAPAVAHVLRHDGTNFVNVLGTAFYEVAGAASAAQTASQPVDSDLTAIAALTTTSYGRSFLTLANQAALFALLPTDTDGTLASNSDAKIATQKAVKTYADALIGANDAMVYKGVINASANPNYPAANAGDTYRISVAGKIGGAAGVNVEVGDMLTALADLTAAGNQATVGTSWNIIQANIDGAVTGPASAVSADFATFSGTSGKILQDSGVSLDTDTALAANSATRIPSQSAVKAYAQPIDADLTAIAALATTTFGRGLLTLVDDVATRTLLSVYSKAEIGDPTTDFVATFNAGLA